MVSPSGTGAPTPDLEASPSSLGFGAQSVNSGTHDTRSVTISNQGSTSGGNRGAIVLARDAKRFRGGGKHVHEPRAWRELPDHHCLPARDGWRAISHGEYSGRPAVNRRAFWNWDSSGDFFSD